MSSDNRATVSSRRCPVSSDVSAEESLAPRRRSAKDRTAPGHRVRRDSDDLVVATAERAHIVDCSLLRRIRVAERNRPTRRMYLEIACSHRSGFALSAPEQNSDERFRGPLLTQTSEIDASNPHRVGGLRGSCRKTLPPRSGGPGRPRGLVGTLPILQRMSRPHRALAFVSVAHSRCSPHSRLSHRAVSSVRWLRTYTAGKGNE
jgi:hypothetical protein